MRLNVSPKVAIDKIDALVREGADMLSWLYDEYDELEKKMKEEEEADEQAEEERIERIRNEPDTLPMAAFNGIALGSIPNMAKMMALSQPRPLTMFIGRQTKVGWVGIEEMEKSYDEWIERTKAALKEIFTDFAPVYSFINARGEWFSMNTDRVYEKHINMSRSLEAKIDRLIAFYNSLASNIRNPLVYLKDQAKLCFYDFICPLKADSNEAALCAFMFQHGVGEKVEMVDVYNYIYGEQREVLNTTDRDKIENAYDGINRKTNRSFGFPILSKDKTTLSISLPSRVTANLF